MTVDGFSQGTVKLLAGQVNRIQNIQLLHSGMDDEQEKEAVKVHKFES